MMFSNKQSSSTTISMFGRRTAITECSNTYMSVQIIQPNDSITYCSDNGPIIPTHDWYCSRAGFKLKSRSHAVPQMAPKNHF